MMLKAKQNSFLKWFIGIVLLIVALCSFMSTAFAAVPAKGENTAECVACKDIIYYFVENYSGIPYETYFGTGSIPGYSGTGQAYSESEVPLTNEPEVVSYNGGYLCLSCLKQKISEYKASTLNATVPASLPIHVGEDGKVTTASNASIKNNGSKPIVISSINIAASSGWTVQSKVDATNAKAGSKVIAIGFNNSWATPNSGNASGSVNTSDFGKISASGTLNLAYDAVIPVAAAGGSSDETAATATIVVAFPGAPTLAAGLGWYKSSVNQNTITKITLMDSYTPTTTANETWAADVNRTGDITCYRTGTEIIMAGNGAGKILANPNSSFMFADSRYSSGFEKLTAIENLRLLDTSKVTDMSSMFENCSGLTNLNVSSFDTSKVTNMSSMFENCSGLTSLDLSNFDTSNVTYMRYMFQNCSGLTSLDLSNFNTSKVKNMSFMFYDCSGLTSLDVSGFNTSNVTDMRYMFQNCSGLTSLDVSGFNTSNVTNMDFMFQNCSGLTSLDASGFDTSNVTDMLYMFQNCSGLTSLDVSGFNTSNVTNMDLMFQNCSGLTTIYAGDTWNTDKVTNSDKMFFGCTKLPNFSSSKVDATAATFTTNGGYLTHKAATKSLKLNVDQSGTVNGYTENAA